MTSILVFGDDIDPKRNQKGAKYFVEDRLGVEKFVAERLLCEHKSDERKPQCGIDRHDAPKGELGPQGCFWSQGEGKETQEEEGGLGVECVGDEPTPPGCPPRQRRRGVEGGCLVWGMG